MKKYITQCPHCSTRFRVVPDHIRISNGWVRCGHCREVFDARPSMAEWHAPPLPAPVPAPTPAPALPPIPASIPASTFALVPLSSTAAPSPTSEQGRVVLPFVSPPPAPRSVALQPDDLAQAPLPPGTDTVDSFHADIDGLETVPAALDAPTSASPLPPLLTATPQAATTPVPCPPQDNKDNQDPPSPTPPEVSFVRQARQQAFWRQTWVRLLLSTAAVGLLGVLGAQGIMQERDRIVATHPEWRPWAQHICQTLGCTIGLVKHINAVHIDSSALVDLKNGTYRFEVTLVNTAAYPVAVPAVELGITNANGQVVASRVLLPTEWPTPPIQLAPRAEHALHVHLALDKPDEWPMNGYKALVFYP